ncbi:MAG: 50S ribosomal protein L6 [Planctomycetes bacterium]|nr:50S ribosomal protein L6 [Planctomycetota bacterium]
MSRIGKKPVPLPAGVSVSSGNEQIEVKGPKGSLSFPLYPQVKVRVEGGQALVEPSGEGGREVSALHGLTRACLANMVAGVTKGFEKKLEIHGVGWNVKLEGKTLVLSVGFAHTVKVAPPKGIDVVCPTNTTISISGIDKQAVGQFAAKVRQVRPPEPYKGKGIKYAEETIRRKSGKAFGS